MASTPDDIHQLVLEANFEAIKYLIHLDTNLIDTVDETYGRTPLIICAYKKSHFEIAKYLLDSGCDINIQSNFKWNNWTALMTACFYGNSPVVEALVNANANLDLVDVAGNTALQLALEGGHADCIQIILSEKETNSIEARLLLEKSLQDAVLINNDCDLARRFLEQINKDNIK